ncbi:hypothetical protein PIB30_054445 [Stylosanthes scabra]|uniref:Uncharacterized protein n=1 Tax=Stylosanthes scabra TaxID=79078 RepID=A0ABU6SIY5_9FABA|nr:hypothetical protein [Stylosanthes scabra]
MVQTTSDKGAIVEEEIEEEDDEEEEDEEDDDWLYELLAKLAGESYDSEDEYEEADEDEMVEVAEVADEKEVSSPDKEEEFLIATVYGGNEEKPEDIPEKNIAAIPATHISRRKRSLDGKKESVGEIKQKEATDRAVIPKHEKEPKTPSPSRRRSTVQLSKMVALEFIWSRITQSRSNASNLCPT